MAYKLRCNRCGHTYVAARSYYACPRSNCEASHPTLIGEIVDLAVDVAVAYVAADIVTSVASSVVDNLFDW